MFEGVPIHPGKKILHIYLSVLLYVCCLDCTAAVIANFHVNDKYKDSDANPTEHLCTGRQIVWPS